MGDAVLIRQYSEDDIAKVDIKEVWRYAGYRGVPDSEQEDLNANLLDVLKVSKGAFAYKVVYLKSDTLPFEHNSKNLSNLLSDCTYFYMFAATIGVEIDRLIGKSAKLSPVKSLLFQALGAERIEALCDRFCEDIKAEEAMIGNDITLRFSPGYGDLPLEIQHDFFRILDCNRKIGISLNDSLLMSPSKSVTAVFGVKER